MHAVIWLNTDSIFLVTEVSRDVQKVLESRYSSEGVTRMCTQIEFPIQYPDGILSMVQYAVFAAPLIVTSCHPQMVITIRDGRYIYIISI